MLRALRKLKNEPVNVTFTDESFMGDGIESGKPKAEVVTLYREVSP